MANSTLTLTMRPAAFDEVIGLKEAVATIKKKLEDGVPRGFLLTGPFGTGKTTLALIIARAVQGWDFEGQPSINEVNGANYRKIEDMRRLAASADSLPMVGTYSVIILDEVHQLTKEAQQILLKELEKRDAPTVWILATTDPDKLNAGVRDRCFSIRTKGMDEKEREALVVRAAKELKNQGDHSEFLKALKKGNIVSPRKILMAFELYHNGLSVEDAIAAMVHEIRPEYMDIALGVMYGQWYKPYTMGFIKEKDGSPKQFKAVAEQLHLLDLALKKKTPAEAADAESHVVEEIPADASAETADAAVASSVDGDDMTVTGKADAARDIKVIVAGMLKNNIAKPAAKFTGNYGATAMKKAGKAAEALFILSHCGSPSPNDAGMEWAATIGGLLRVHQKMQENQT